MRKCTCQAVLSIARNVAVHDIKKDAKTKAMSLVHKSLQRKRTTAAALLVLRQVHHLCAMLQVTFSSSGLPEREATAKGLVTW